MTNTKIYIYVFFVISMEIQDKYQDLQQFTHFKQPIELDTLDDQMHV